jgi:hypothetical protein
VMNFADSCGGTSSACGSTFTYSNTTNTSDFTTVTITSNNGNPACMSVGQHTCSYASSGNALSFQCTGGSIYNYTRM